MLRTLFTVLITVFYISAFADQAPEPAPPLNQKAQQAPFAQQAMDACKSKHNGDSCSFTGPKGMAHEGTCLQRPRDGSMICVPKPPKVAIDACNGKKEGDSCSFTGFNKNTINGTCLTPPQDKSELACRPARSARPQAPQQH